MTFQIVKMRNDSKAYDEKTKERIRKNITIVNGCWEWNLYKDKEGYGYFKYKKKNCRVHRISYLLFRGKLNPKLIIHHICGNSCCVNPIHLKEIAQEEHIFHGNCVSAVNSRKKNCPKCGGKYTIIKYPSLKDPCRICKPCTEITKHQYDSTHKESRSRRQKQRRLKIKQKKEMVPIAI